jgi:pimeloyl-ACP methyl ester carboxylesterase
VSVPVDVLVVQAMMAGTLCRPPGASTVMVLVPGSTYNQTYWDFPYQLETYDFRLAMNRAGYATLVIDRLGVGKSSSAGRRFAR